MPFLLQGLLPLRSSASSIVLSQVSELLIQLENLAIRSISGSDVGSEPALLV